MPNHLENQEKGILKLWWMLFFGRKKVPVFQFPLHITSEIYICL